MELYEAQAIGFGLIYTLLGLVSFLYVITTSVTALMAVILVALGIALLYVGMSFLRSRTVPQSSGESIYRRPKF